MTATDFDIELQLLLDAIYLKYHYDFRGYAAASLKRRAAHGAGRASAAQTLSQLQDRVLHEPAVFPALLDFLTVQVSEMFRDPAYFRALREQVVPLLRTYPSLKVWVAGCSTGEEVYSLAILLREEGLLDAHADLRDRHQPAGAAEGRGRRLRRRPHRRLHREPSPVRRALVALRLLHRRLRPRGVRQVAEAAHRLLRPQPRHRQRVRRGAAGLVPQRAHLLQPRAAGPRARPVPRRALPQGLSRPRLEGVAALLVARGRVRRARPRRPHLPEAGRARDGARVARTAASTPS